LTKCSLHLTALYVVKKNYRLQNIQLSKNLVLL
jgi:hypothetical protein